MWLDMIHGTIDRRVLLNYRCDPVVLQRILPPAFRPKLYRGYGIGGVCLIRFRGLRPRFVPEWLGLSSENAAHRIAVEWEQEGKYGEGVFIPRRDTNSGFNKLFGGRVFPGIFQRASFESKDTLSSVSVRIERKDGTPEVVLAGRIAQGLPSGSIFPSLAEAAGFFSLGATGYSATRFPGRYHGMELKTLDWTIAPLDIEKFHSSFFDDQERFPIGTVEVDCALLMRNIPHEWHSRPDLFEVPQGGGLTTRSVV